MGLIIFLMMTPLATAKGNMVSSASGKASCIASLTDSTLAGLPEPTATLNFRGEELESADMTVRSPRIRMMMAGDQFSSKFILAKKDSAREMMRNS